MLKFIKGFDVKSIQEMSEKSFLEFVRKIYNSGFRTEKQQIAAILEFKRLVEHPSGSDLIYYPEEGKDGPEEVVIEVKKWLSANGKPGFKDN
ncbi:colicin immunity protein/pyocin immunity protein [Pseudomonas baetica]|uniref:Colicin immunity protein/pyocin immunity protein n=2 Tax=Pseudomonas baetica TaxID=674054 RepID=A0ABX4PTV6_9PSED|nr:colicin immunity protein/pyocin immunity protein [Pseudomonas baetica]PTC18166.1 bacteriocin immunity protein [Pseudomonas baetica]